MAELLTEDQISEFKDAFSLFDQDLDGKITLKELNIIIRALGFNPSEEQLTQIRNDLNIPEEGLVSFPDFLSIMVHQINKNPIDSEKELREAFKIFDKEGSGFIPTSELRYILTSLGEKLTKEEADDLMKVADPKGTGKINYEEFIKVILT